MKKTVILLLAAAIAASAGYYYYKAYYLPDFRKSASAVNYELEKILVEKILINPHLILDKKKGAAFRCTAKLPLRFKPRDIERIFTSYAASKRGVKADVSVINKGRAKGVVVSISLNDKIISKIRLVRNTRPKIAVIIDDWGYNDRTHGYLESIKQPFTIAVLPGLLYSEKAAKHGVAHKKEVIVHLPLEPDRKLPLEKNTIKADMPFGQIRMLTEKQIASVPYAVGVNNHQGSLVTGNEEIMRVIFEVMQGKNMFFIDSRTNRNTVAYKTAGKMGIPVNKRNIFIDNKKEAEYSRMQLDKLKKAAVSNGYAIGIGHDDPVTMEALAVNMPKIEAEGFEFVYASEVVF